ncbi:MAG: SDR family oxidoreductase [bacterium]|nr:SDR family oxidoreductase [bacterium]
MSSSELHVVFGTGPLGKSTMLELVKHGKQVRMVNRSGTAKNLPQGVEVVKGDAYDSAQVAQLTKGAVAVYQCAQPHYYEWAEKFPPLQAAIIEGVSQSGAKLIVGDNLYMYGDPNGKPIREDSPINPHTRKGKVRAALSQVVLDAHKSGKIRAAIGRASDFFGPEDEVSGGLTYRPALVGKTANALGNADVPHTYTYVRDFGTLLATLGMNDKALGQIWFTPSAPAITQRDYLQKIYNEAGQPLKIRVGTRPILRVMGLFDKNVREIIEMMYEFEKPFIMDSSKAEKAFGLKATPLDVAIKETIAYFRANPEA